MLKVDNLTFEVNEEGRKRCLVNHVSFQVADGEMLVITGPNGGGKSTLAKVLAGIEKADEGRIFLDEEDISGYDIDHRANAGIGYAFQQPPRFKGMTVARMLSLAAGKDLTEAESCKLLSAVGLYLPIYLSTPIMVGGLVRLYFDKKKGITEEERKAKVNQGILYSSGLIAGEGLVGILLAVFAIIPVGADTLGDAINISKIINLGNIGGLVFFACLVATLVAFINKKEKKTK